jgi:hypothetical protein
VFPKQREKSQHQKIFRAKYPGKNKPMEKHSSSKKPIP